MPTQQYEQALLNNLNLLNGALSELENASTALNILKKTGCSDFEIIENSDSPNRGLYRMRMMFNNVRDRDSVIGALFLQGVIKDPKDFQMMDENTLVLRHRDVIKFLQIPNEGKQGYFNRLTSYSRMLHERDSIIAITREFSPHEPAHMRHIQPQL